VSDSPHWPEDPTPPEGPLDDLSEDPRLVQAVREYTEALEAGQKPDRAAWLARYPELGEALAECLDGLEILHQAAPRRRSLGEPFGVATLGEAQASSPLGDFQITREIGRGGMGIVYEAVQLSLGRRVAIKVLPFAATFDSKQLQRFRHEAQAAAQLHHSNIVPVYAVGCERGIHFYAMQLIEGQSLDHLIRGLRERAGLETDVAGPHIASTAIHEPQSPGGALLGERHAMTAFVPSDAARQDTSRGAAEKTADPVSEHLSTLHGTRQPEFYRLVAGLMAQAAEALEYAHQQGVVHRDIKPGNLLVDGRGHVWITDFGLAHFQVDSGLTQTGDVLGTVRYMSPEQAAGQRVVLDHRTDVYSVGATFYELLTLQPVFSGTSRQSLLVQVLEREPRPPRTIDRSIPEELETIVLKALNKAPEDRYATAQELADDLHRFIRDEPIRARRPSLVERVRKWSRRHPAVVGSAVLAMFVVLVVSLVSNWMIKRANDRANVALAAEQIRSEEAEKRFLQAKQAVDLLIEVSQDELADKPMMQSVRKRLLESALGYYQDFITQRRESSPSQADLIAVEKRLKKILDELSLIEGAGQLILLADRGIQSDLRLTAPQREQLKTLGQEFVDRRRDLFRNFNRLSQTDRQSRFLELARANDRWMRNALTAGQLKRLEQISLQLQGPSAFRQPDVVARLALTEAQREAVRQIEAESMATMWERRRPGPHGPNPGLGPNPGPDDGPGPGPGPGVGPGPGPGLFPGPIGGPGGSREHEAAQRSAVSRIVALLTVEQQAVWHELAGAPYEGRFDMPHRSHFPRSMD
jgi:serine/threonine protein kinase